MCRLAIVDDNESWCFILAFRLRQQGYAVSTFTNSNSFLSQAEQFDLAIVDFSMPSPRYRMNLDGPELIQQVKQQLSFPPLFILISGFFTQDILHQSVNLCPQADAVLSKEVDAEALVEKIVELLSQRRKQQAGSDTLSGVHLPPKFCSDCT
jgi:CheY-like chemotaxis protein